MHILLLPSWYPAHPNDVRGVFFRDQALALSARGHKVGVVAPMMHSMKKFLSGPRPEKSVRRENDNGVLTYRRDLWAALPRVPYGNYLLWQRAADRLLEKYIKEQGRPDIIHAHSAIFGGAVAARWKSRFNLPVVLTEHANNGLRDHSTSEKTPRIRAAQRRDRAAQTGGWSGVRGRGCAHIPCPRVKLSGTEGYRLTASKT